MPCKDESELAPAAQSVGAFSRDQAQPGAQPIRSGGTLGLWIAIAVLFGLLAAVWLDQATASDPALLDDGQLVVEEVVVVDPQGNARIVLSASESGAHLSLTDAAGTTRLEAAVDAGDNTSLFLFDATGQPRAGLIGIGPSEVSVFTDGVGVRQQLYPTPENPTTSATP